MPDYKKTVRYLSLLWLLVLCAAAQLLAQGAGRKQVLEGNQLYAEERYDEANNKYRDAQLDNPESPIIYFNIGDVEHQKSNYEEALEAYRNAIQKSDDPKLQAQGHYNLGNTLYRLNKLQESILAYQEALKLDPDDEQAKYNLEYVRNKLKNEAQQQPQDQQQNQQQQQQQQDQQQGQGDQNQQQEQQQKNDQEQKQQDQQKDEQQQEQLGQEQRKEGELTQEEAERLLEALKNQEKEAQKNKQVQSRGRVRVEKDW